MFSNSTARRFVLRSGEAAPVLVAAAKGDVARLRAIVPAIDAPEREAVIAALRDERVDDEDPTSYSATDLAAAANHVQFLEAWISPIGPFHLSNAFRRALMWLADGTVSWMLKNRAELVPDGPDDDWHAALLDRGRSKEFILSLAHEDSLLSYDSPRPEDAEKLEQGRDAGRRCYRALWDGVFSRFASYPTMEDQLHDYGPMLVACGRWTTYEELARYGHGPTARTWMPFLRGILDTARPTLEARYFLRLLQDFFPGDAAGHLEIATWARGHAVRRWPNPGVLRLLLDQDVVRADANLLSSMLDLSEAGSHYHWGFRERRDLFLCLRLLLSRIAAASGGAGAGSADLATVLDELHDAEGPIRRRRAFVHLLLYFGAGGSGRMLSLALRRETLGLLAAEVL
ncbi:hypothetical protein DFJ74DRAFT_727924 [Hyaloraphidium curvatum]|nr:hypothetical protein DFJ74DRAFT_727924 [Hyaloraphidium curvatum]